MPPDQGYTVPNLGPGKSSYPWWLPNRYSAAQFLINRAKKLSGRTSIGEEAYMAFKRKRAYSNPFGGRSSSYWAGGARPAKRMKTNPKRMMKRPTNFKPPAITQEHDVSVSRGSKRTSKGQRRWKKFVKKVQKATDDNDKTQFLVEANGQLMNVIGNTAQYQQGNVNTLADGSEYDMRLGAIGDIARGPLRFINNLIQQKPDQGTGSTHTKAAIEEVRYKLELAVMTLGIKNLIAQSFVDIYECVANTNITDSDYATAQLAWTQCALNSQTDQTLTYTKLTPIFSGATPYMAPQFGQWWKILKKTRVLMGTGQKVNYTFFVKKRHIQNEKVIGHYATKGVTKDLIIVHNPTYNTDNTVAQQLNLEWSKSYGVKLPGIAGLQTQWAVQEIVT